MTVKKSEAAIRFREQAKQRVLITDGAAGTMIQRYKLTEADYAGDLGLPSDQKGNNDLLVLTKPEVVDEYTRQYLDAGSDIVSTNTFNANSISQADYDAVHLVREINLAASRIARKAADDYQAKDGRPRFVAGAIGPTNKTLSLSPDVNDPAIMAVFEEQAKRGVEIPMMISMTITDMSGRNLSGHSVEAFWHAVRHAHPLTIGLNCAFGADLLRPHVQVLSGIADALVMIYPNAGLPNDLGEYDEQPHTTGGFIKDWADTQLVNVVGGCCGSTPDHIAAMADAVAGKPPRSPHAHDHRTRLGGLDPFTMAA